jgi:ubiquinone/menaquinone biosynthesis C-methylase UbiE
VNELTDTSWRFSYNSNALGYDKFSSFEDSKNKVIAFLKENFNLSSMTVLEVGCGTGRYTKYLANLSKKVIATDISNNMLDICKYKCKKHMNINFANCTAIKLPFEDNSFDLIFASWAVSSMGLIQNKKKAILEMKRVLKKEGCIVLVENHWASDFVKLLGENPNYVGSKVEQICSLEKFKVIKIISSPLIFNDFNDAKSIILPVIRTANLNGLNKEGKVKINHEIVILQYKNTKN